MRLSLARDVLRPGFTLGKLHVDGVFLCYTCEDESRPEGVKVPKETCIPPGKYELVLAHSPKYKRRMPRLLDVPMFTGILIHPGNTPEDTEGCILVGMSRDEKTGTISSSRVAWAALMARLSAASLGADGITIEVVESKGIQPLGCRLE